MSVDPEATPDTGNSATDTATQEQVNWEQRFKDTQAAYTQSQQRIADLEKLTNGEDPNQFQQLLDRYGYEVDDPEPDPEPAVNDGAGTPAADDPRLKQFEQFMESQNEKEYQQALRDDWTGWEQHVRSKAGDVKLADWEIKALQLDSVGDNGFPVPPAKADQILAQRLEEREAFLNAQVEERMKQRRRPRAPHVPAGGGPADGPGKDPAEMTRSELLQYQMERLNAESA